MNITVIIQYPYEVVLSYPSSSVMWFVFQGIFESTSHLPCALILSLTSVYSTLTLRLHRSISRLCVTCMLGLSVNFPCWDVYLFLEVIRSVNRWTELDQPTQHFLPCPAVQDEVLMPNCSGEPARCTRFTVCMSSPLECQAGSLLFVPEQITEIF